MKILAIDSSGQTASVALWEDDLTVAEFLIHAKKTHSQTLLPMLEAIREKIEFHMEEIDAIAVTSGPGSFTGLRIGSATAKGFGLALNKPIIPVPTLEGLAYNLYGTEHLICPLMDARRNQTYTGLYEFVGKDDNEYDIHVIKEQCAVEVSEILEICNKYDRSVIFLGDGVPVFREQIERLVKVPYVFAPAHLNRQRAAAVAALAAKYYGRGKIQTAAEHAPEYLRLAQAERERKEREKADLSDITIRRMESRDAAAAAALERVCFSQPWTENGYLSTLADENALYLMAETREGEPVGICGLLDVLGEGNISNVAVAEPYRRKKVAERMLGELLARGRERGIAAYTLEVRASNKAAIGLYEKFGFAVEGRRKNFYENPREDALLFWLRET